MFDNPEQELRRLQDRLLAEEGEWKRPEDDPDAALAEVKQILAEDDWEETSREPLYRRYIPYADALTDAEEPEVPELPKKEKGIRTGLWIALIAELSAMAGVLCWWLLWK